MECSFYQCTKGRSFNQWTADETLYYFILNISEFAILMNKNNGLKKKWRSRNMNGETLIFIYKFKVYSYLHEFGFIKALVVLKIFKAVKNKIND